MSRQEEEIKTEDEQSSEKVTEDEGTLEVKEKSKIKLPPRKTILIFALVLLIISGVVIGITLDLQR